MKIALPVSFFLLSFCSFAQSSVVDWGITTTGFYEERTKNIIIDNQNNILSLGIFTGTIDLDPGNGTFNITNSIGTGSYIQILDSNGNFLWGECIGAIYARGIDIDGLGNIYITGNFGGTQDFDPGPAVYNLTANSTNQDVFIVKLDPSGNFLWAKNMGIGSNTNYGHTIKTDQSGNVYVAGHFIYMIDLDPGPSSFALTSFGAGDGFLVKLDASGNFLWGHHLGGGGPDEGSILETDISGNIYCVVHFDGALALPAYMIGAGAGDIGILKFDNSGNLLWACSVGGPLNDTCTSLSVDVTGNLYLTGSFRNTVDFDPASGAYNLTAVGSGDAFVLKLDNNGQFLWAKQFGGSSYETGKSVRCMGNNNIYVGGKFSGTVDFDPGPGIYNVTANGSSNAFFAKLDASGNFKWVQAFGNTTSTEISNVVLNANSSHFLNKGSFTGTVDFDPGAGVYNLTAMGYSTFIIKHKECTFDSGFFNQTACRNYLWNGNSYSTSGTIIYPVARPGMCDSIAVLNLTIHQPPANVVLQTGDTLTASATNAYYQWVDCDNNFSSLPGATNSMYVANKVGNYAVIVTDIVTGCSDTSDCMNIAYTSANDVIINENNVNIYPNPTSGITTILFSKNQPDGTIEIVTATGQTILKNQFENTKEIKFNLSSHPHGVYFVSVIFSSEKHYFKLMKY